MFGFVVESIIELALEGTAALGTNRRVSKWVRYPLLAFIGVFYLAVTAILAAVGYMAFASSRVVGSLLWLLALIFVATTLHALRKQYRQARKG